MITCLADSALAMLDEKACRSWWLRRLHPAGPVCPQCGVSVTGQSAETWANDGLVRCRDCGKWHDCKTGTLICGLHMSWQQLFLYIVMASRKDRTAEIARWCKISDDTVRRLAKRFGGVNV